jgi:hypothetical protein
VDPHDLAPKCPDRRISEVWDVEVSVFSEGHCKLETSIVSHFSKQFLRPLKQLGLFNLPMNMSIVGYAFTETIIPGLS